MRSFYTLEPRGYDYGSSMGVLLTIHRPDGRAPLKLAAKAEWPTPVGDETEANLRRYLLQRARRKIKRYERIWRQRGQG